jgi:hypothetical protein
VFSD